MSTINPLAPYLRQWWPSLAPPTAVFARDIDGHLQPLILALSVDIWKLVSTYLTSRDVKNLICIGSPALTQLLQQRGGISSFWIRNITQRLTKRGAISVNLFCNFPKLTEFVLILDRQNVQVDWKISLLPPTLKRLHLSYQTCLIPFVNVKLESGIETLRIFRGYYSQFDCIKRFAQLAEDNPQNWLRASELLPNLSILELKSSQQYVSLANFLPTLPESLGTLQCLIRDNSLVVPKLPASLTSLTLAEADLTPEIAQLGLYLLHLDVSWSIESALVLQLPNLLTLKCEQVLCSDDSSFTQSQVLTCLPRSLETFRCNSMARYDLSFLPRGLKDFKAAVFAFDLLHLPPGLTSLSSSVLNINTVDAMLALPRTLLSLSMLSCPLSDLLVEALPPSLTSLEIFEGSFHERYLLHLLPRLSYVSVSHWTCCGLLMPPNVDTVSSWYSMQFLHSRGSGYPIPIINIGAIKSSFMGEVTHLAPSVTMLDSVRIHPSVRYKELPRGLLTLPKSFIVRDTDDQDIKDLPPTLESLTVAGPFRFSSWTSLPPKSFKSFKNTKCTIVLEDSDIRKAMELSNAQSNKPSFDRSLSIPRSLITSLVPKGPYGTSPLIPHFGTNAPYHAIWKREHYDLIPESITSLSIDSPICNIKFWPSSSVSYDNVESEESPKTPIKLPPSLTYLKLCASGELLKRTHEPLKRIAERPPKLIAKHPSTLTNLHLTLTDLPVTLEHLEIHGRVGLEELEDIGRFTSLKSLTLGFLIKKESSQQNGYSYVDPWNFSALMRNLPSSLTKLHLLGYPWATDVIHAIPRQIEDLAIASAPTAFTELQFSKFPPQLTSLSINCKNDPSEYQGKLPSTLKHLSLNTKLEPCLSHNSF